MTLRFIDGFDHYATAEITQKWTSKSEGATNDVQISSSNGRRSTGALYTFSNITDYGYLTKTLDAQGTWIVGFAFNPSGLPSGKGPILELMDGSSVQCRLDWDTDGTLKFYRGDAATLLGTSSAAISTGTWSYIEVKVVISDAAGTVDIAFNGSSVLSLTSQDTKATSNATANSIRIGQIAGNTIRKTIYFDDLYICDGQGSTNNTLLGDIRVDAYMPNGNGNSSQWTGSDSDSTDNYLLVDEASTNGDTDYVQATTANYIDSYTVTDMSHTPANIFGVQINMMSKKDDAGTKQIAAHIRQSSTNYALTTQSLSTSYSDVYEIKETDPATSTAWTKSGFNSAEFGVKVIT